MKTKARNGVIAAALASVALCSALCATGGGHAALAEKAVAEVNESIGACEQVLTAVKNDLESIVSGYNRVYNSDWAASSIEYSSPVFLLEDNAYGIYLDFDANNGYAVITTDKKICGLETNGDLEFLRGEKKLYYSYIDGFMYVDNNKQFQKYVQNDNLLDEDARHPKIPKEDSAYTENVIPSFNNTAAPKNMAAASTTPYPGQPKVGADGEIDPKQIKEYVAARYPGFTLDWEDSLSDFKCSIQFETSYYIKQYPNNFFANEPEGNCVLTAMFNVMRDWGKHGFVKVPYDKTNDITTVIFDDPLYADYGKGTKTGTDDKGSYEWVIKNADWSNSLSRMPVLYSNIRGYAIKNGYKPDFGYYDYQVPSTIKYVANFLYNNNIDVKHTTSVYTVMDSILNNKSCVLSIQGSSTYPHHAVAVIGYYRFLKETKVNDWYSAMDFKYFYVVADGGNGTPQIFDPNTPANPTLNFYCFSYILPRC